MKSLKFLKSDSVELVKIAFPDANEWLELYCRGKSRVSELVKELDYKHGVELITGFFCLFGDKEVLKYSVGYIREHKDALKGKLEDYIQEHGVNPHPAILLKEFAQPDGPIKRPAAVQPSGSIKRPAAAQRSEPSI